MSHCNCAGKATVLTKCRHGGSTVSQYLRQELHGLLESADKSHIPEMYQYVKELGGYFKRFNGGLLSPWVKPSPASAGAGEMDLHARATLTFFEVRAFQSADIFLSNMCQTVTSVGGQKPRGGSRRKSVRIHRLRCYPSIFG